MSMTEYEGKTPVTIGDTVLRYDDISDRWHDAIVTDVLAAQFTVEWRRPTGHGTNPMSFDFLFYADKGRSWKLN